MRRAADLEQFLRLMKFENSSRILMLELQRGSLFYTAAHLASFKVRFGRVFGLARLPLQ